MAVTQADIDALNTAIASGERQVTIGGQTITYRSIADLIAARNDLRNEMQLGAVQTGAATPRPKSYSAVYGGKGYDE